MRVHELRAALDALATAYAEAGKASNRTTLRRVIKWLDASSAETVAQFSEQVRLQRRPKVSGKNIDQAVVKEHVEALESAIDGPRFERAIGQLKLDRRVRRPELYAIAHRYTSGRSRYNNRQDALDAISYNFIQRGQDKRHQEAARVSQSW